MGALDRVLQVALRVQEEFLARRWEFCFIGGVAVQAWGEVRMTGDVDLSLLTGWGNEERFLDGIEDFLRYRTTGGRQFALRSRVGLFESLSGIGVDIALAAIPFEEVAVRRAVEVDFGGGLKLRVCAATDLVVHKAFANRPIDWEDVEAILIRSGGAVDRDEVVRHLAPLAALKEEQSIVDRFLALSDRVDREESEGRGDQR